ncbi:hypothetical protein, partial [Bradyrhizobium sp.]|uniref:hypothetical protein n=1 Tax=Bradyrhizobium sp. TaxID=376 RepID=UPI00290AFB22
TTMVVACVGTAEKRVTCCPVDSRIDGDIFLQQPMSVLTEYFKLATDDAHRTDQGDRERVRATGAFRARCY